MKLFGSAPKSPAELRRTKLEASLNDALSEMFPGTRKRGLGSAVSRTFSAMAQSLRIAAPYEAASPKARMARVGNPGPAELARRADYLTALARHWYRNDGALRHAFNTLAAGVVGTGPVPRPKFKELGPLFAAWSKHSDVTGALPFGLQVHQAYLDGELAGGCFARMRPRRQTDGFVVPFQVQLLPTEVCPRSENRPGLNGVSVVAGVEIGPLDQRLAYWMTPRHPGDAGEYAEPNIPLRVAAIEVCHIFRPAAVGSPRGETRAVAAMLNLTRLHGYVDAEMMRKQVTALLAGFIERTNQDSALPDEEKISELISALSWDPGSLIEMPQGTKVTFPTINDSSNNATEFIKLLCLIISAALGVPYELVWGDWSDSSDRTGAFASTYFDQLIVLERARLEHQLLEPIWKRFVDLAVATGLWTPPPGVPQSRWYEVSWTWPRRAYKHVLQDAQAIAALIDNRIIDRDTARLQFGLDPAEVDMRIVQAAARARLLGIEDQSPVKIVDSDFSLRIQEIERLEIERDVASLEMSEADQSVLQ